MLPDTKVQFGDSSTEKDQLIRTTPTAATGCCTQLLVTLKRMLLIKSREPISWAVEFLIPILFIAGTIALWASFGDSKSAAESYFDPDGATAAEEMFTSFSKNTCYNESEAVIAGLSSCSELSEETIFCVNNPTSGAPPGFCYTTEALYSVRDVNYVIPGVTSVIPTFDQMVLIQWVVRDVAYRNSIPVGMDLLLDSLQSSGALFFAPDTAETQALVKHLNTSTDLFQYVYGGTMSPAEAEALVVQRAARGVQKPSWGIIVANSMLPTDYNVAIRLNATALPRTSIIVNPLYFGGLQLGSSELYISSGFLTLQKVIADFYVDNIAAVGTAVGDFVLVPMPTGTYDSQTFLELGTSLAPLIVVLGFLYPVSQLTKRIVIEKELKLREAMLIMGLTQLPMYLSLFIVYTLQYFACSLAIATLLKVTYLKNTDFGIVFFLFFFFAVSTISLSAMLATFFNKARLAALLVPLIYFVFAIPLFAMQSVGDGAKYGISLLSPSGFAIGLGIIFEHELGGGMSASGLAYFRDKPTLLFCLIILVVDTAIYLVLMLYLDAVLPKDWGTPKHPLFFILDPIKMCFCRGRTENGDNLEDGRAPNGVFEEIPDNGRTAVRVVGLTKKFRRGGTSFLAVNNLQWTLREGEISVLLGHNGAGKSTTMNMMTGMLEPDEGDCYIYGKSIRFQQAAARQEIGFCPQHNILWPELTCREHLDYYAAIKGLDSSERKDAVGRMLEEVDLVDKTSYRSSALSGGQKRKLSVAIAFVGRSRLIFLDEPTAGMDVGARRYTWELLRRMADTHTILLTTHYMDEADLLGHTVAIMSQGRLQCSGSSIFLKSRLGVGYNVTMSVDMQVSREPIGKLVQVHVPEAESIASGAGEIAFRLPVAKKAKFPELLGALETTGSDLGVRGYSLSATTLEEIFLKIAEGDTGEHEAAEVKQSTETTSSVWDVELQRSESAMMWSQFKAMMAKRLWNSLRDRRTQCFQIVCPVICVLLAMLFTLVKFFDSPTVVLDNSVYKTATIIDVTGCNATISGSVTYGGGAQARFPQLAEDTAQRMDSFLLQTHFTESTERYGAFACSDPELSGRHAIFYNTSSFPEVAISLANFYRGVVRTANGDSAVMQTTVQTMPITEQETARFNSIYALMIGTVVMIPFTFIPSTFVGWIVKERECKARHLQNVSGLRFVVYWLSNFLFDTCAYIITATLVIIIFLIFQRKEYVGADTIGPTIVLFMLYGLSGIAMAYAVSFLFNEHSTAQNVVMLANFIAGFLLALAISFLSLNASTENVASTLRWIFRLIPSYCIGEGIINLGLLQLTRSFTGTGSAWEMKTIGWACVYMAIETPAFLLITLFIDHPSRRQRSQRLFHNPDAPSEPIEGEDADVAQERGSVLDGLKGGDRASDLVQVAALRKQYPNGKVAVRNLTFGVKPGEVFGFLGTNGAGKTTTISILCQEFYPTSGRAYICGYDIVTNSREALQCVGYCPQFDACLDLLTVEEHLYLYAGVRGIVPAKRDSVVSGLMTLCELTKYRKTLSHELSGGNRRKLSVAISLMGGPRVVFLDEPSAGMDPVARRGLWTAIQTVAANCSVVLTTHHLEEVEALAHRVAIMVDGALRCIGDKTHLKKKYGSGFEVHVRVAHDTEAVVQRIKTFFAETFPDATLNEYRSQRFVYALPQDTKLSRAFTVLEENKERLEMTDYTVSQTSIEQVFLRISSEAELAADLEAAERLEKKSKCCGCMSCC